MWQKLSLSIYDDPLFKVENMHFFPAILELFWPSFKVGQTKVEKMHFFRLSQNSVLKVHLGTYLIDN